jgi:peroxiredoxin
LYKAFTLKSLLQTFLAAFALLLAMNLLAQTTMLKPGEKAPLIKLKSTEGKTVSFDSYPAAKGFIIVFIANSCPFSKIYEQRIIDLHKKYNALNYPVLAINSNDPQLSPEDRISKMKERAKAKRYPFAYLIDDKQVAADSYGARSTPQVFIISKQRQDYILEYSGAVDNDASNKNPDKVNYTSDAVDALIRNTKPAIRTTKSIGCSISRKKN